MKKILAVVLSVIILCSALYMPLVASANSITLPDGGQVVNTGCDTVYGRSSGGVDGYANFTCTISITQGGWFSNDKAEATITSDVHSGLTATVWSRIYYATTEGVASIKEEGESDGIPEAGFSVTATAPNDYGTRGVGCYGAYSDNRGDWICGTTIELEG